MSEINDGETEGESVHGFRGPDRYGGMRRRDRIREIVEEIES